MVKPVRVLGVGSPVVDLLAQVPDEFLSLLHGAKGGMELIGPETMEEILAQVPGTVVRAAGGSAGNTTFALAKMGVSASFLGKLGVDIDGDYYRDAFSTLGGETSRFKSTTEIHTARCLSLITPDSERTMRTDLGAAAKLSPDEISPADFEGVELVHAEGYLLFNPALAEAVLASAKAAGCKVSLDLGSFEVVRAAESELHLLLSRYVDYVFANEEEAAAFCGDADPKAGLEALAALCSVAAVKVGAEGAWIRRGEETVQVSSVPVNAVVDTTGAGDLWAAGFLGGVLAGQSLEVAGHWGALLGAAVVQEIGAKLPEPVWARVLADMEETRA